MRASSPGRYLLLGGLLALLSAVLLYPIWLTVRGGLLSKDGGFTLHHVLDVLADPLLRGGLVIDADGDGKRIRDAILQLAVRGRLVAQEAGDESVAAPAMSKRFDPEDAWDVPWIESKASEGWLRLPLDALGDWSSGGTPSRKNSAYYGPGTPWLKISDLNYGRVREAEESITESGLANSTARPIPVDAVLIAMYGSIGKCGIAGIPCSSNQATAHCICDLALVVPDFLLLEALALEEILLSLGRGGAQANINQGILRHACIPIPPLAEQHRIVAKDDELMGHAAVVEDRHLAASSARVAWSRTSTATARSTVRTSHSSSATGVSARPRDRRPSRNR